MRILNIGELELTDSMGSDLSVVRAARISNGAAAPEWREDKDDRLINFLAAHKHTSPFEHVTFTFYVKAPIFVLREWMRHRTLSYNERSARYKPLEPDFWFPAAARITDPDNKQGSIATESSEKMEFVRSRMAYAYQTAWQSYETLLGGGIAREMARSVLPVGIYSEMYVTGNLLNWVRFAALRTSKEAQLEIREYASAISDILSEKCPISFPALMRSMG